MLVCHHSANIFFENFGRALLPPLVLIVALIVAEPLVEYMNQPIYLALIIYGDGETKKRDI
jgi:hypothetical protein